MEGAIFPKYKVGQKVYVEHRQRVLKCLVNSIMCSVNRFGLSIKYTLLTEDNVFWTLNEEYLFASLEEAVDKCLKGKNNER